MKGKNFLGILFLIILSAAASFAQQTIVINDPGADPKPANVSSAEEALIKNNILPKVREYWAKSEGCEEEYRVTGEATGSFSKPKSNQKLIFYEFCQTGNGLGNNGLILIENGKVIGSYISESGWAMDLKALPDINQNGLDEFLVYYSGGMHQGQGGIGVDVMEFSLANIKGLGWFQAENFDEEAGDWSYKVSVKPGRIPIFYHEKYVSKNNKLQSAGKVTPFKLTATISEFTSLK